MPTEPVFVQITSAGADTGPFRVYGSGSSGLYALHNIDYPIAKATLLTGEIFDVPDGYSSSIVVQSVEGYSYPFCTNSTSSFITSTTSTTSTTTTILTGCGTFGFGIPDSRYYYNVETIEEIYGSFYWDLPVDMGQISSIVSWSLQVTASQYNGNSTGTPYTATTGLSALRAKRVTVSSSLSGSDGNTVLGYQSLQPGFSGLGNLFSGSFKFYNISLPTIPYLTTRFTYIDSGVANFTPFDYLWQDRTIINLNIIYKDLCNVTKTFYSQTIIPRFLITDSSGETTGGGTCLIEGTKILLSDNTEKLIENLTEKDILKGINIDKEENQYNLFINHTHIPVEIEKITSHNVEEIIDIFGLKMTPSHKHLILRNNTDCLVVRAKDIVEGDKVYILDEMKFKEVDKIKKYSGEFKVYNIEIKGDYKYYFANNQLTHNKIDPTPPVDYNTII